MRACVITLSALFAAVLALEAAESKELKKASLAATEQLFANPKVLEISVEVPQAQLDALKREPRVYVKATVKEGTNVLANTGFRFKGTNMTSKIARPDFTLKFNEFITDQRLQGQRKLGFESSRNDPTYVGEAVANELFRSAGIPASRNTFALVKLNGKDVGLYVVSEGVNKDFLDRHFDKSKGNLYEGDGTDITDKLDKDSGDGSGQADVKALAEAARESNLEQRWKKLQTLLDVDRFLSFVGVEVITGHTNGYAMGKARYRIYHDPTNDKMIFMPHGIEAVFGRSDTPITPEFKGVLARAVLETPEGKKRYRAELNRLLTKAFRLDVTQSRIKELAGKVKPALKEGAENYDKAVNDLLERVAARHKFLEQQLKQS
ncbi:MAG TPA: CotH kinase family protein [Candidatus Binatia bacterium]|nr:CotH kinase family protein [Candidatus Binatia bacterium]